MVWVSMEHSKLSYRIDFFAYGLTVLGLGTWLVLHAPSPLRWALLGWTVLGILSWSVLEYVLHRHVLHGLPPFKLWHAEHHRRPGALICAPTLLSASLIGSLVFAPAAWLLGLWPAQALTLGVLLSYLHYAITHHATHHWHGNSAWLKRRKRWHAQHHHQQQSACFGVTTSVWDRWLGTAPP